MGVSIISAQLRAKPLCGKVSFDDSRVKNESRKIMYFDVIMVPIFALEPTRAVLFGLHLKLQSGDHA